MGKTKGGASGSACAAAGEQAQPKHPTRPCADCPFRRVGFADGGGSPFTYIGQAEGPFCLPCHSVPGYDQKTVDMATAPQCAGAAIYRANVGVDRRMPPGLHELPPDREVVFASAAELLSAHTGNSVEACEELLGVMTPEWFLRQEMLRRGVRKVPIKQEG